MPNKKLITTTFIFAITVILLPSREAYPRVEHDIVETQYTGTGVNLAFLFGADLLSGGNATNTSNVGLGGRLGYHLNNDWEIGASYNSTSNSSVVNDVTNKTSVGLLLADLNYHFPEDWNPLYLGIRGGAGFTTGYSTVSRASSSTDLAYGFVGGYDVKIARSFTVGPRISYTMISQKNLANMSDFQAQAGLKYFF